MPGDLLRTLNAAIDSSEVYTGYKKARIEELRLRKTGARSTEDIYQINCEIIDNYESFLCDSAEYYVLQNIRIARSLGNPDHLSESRLRLAFLYSLSGLFLQANDIFRSIDYGRLPADQKCRYYWNSIRYYENLIKYTNDSQLSDEYKGEIGRCRDSLLSLLPVGSTDWTGRPSGLSSSWSRDSRTGRSKYSKAYSVRAIPRPIPMPWVRCAWPKPTGRRATARWRNAT